MSVITIHYGPVYARTPGQSVALCHPAEWAIMTTTRHAVTCRECLALLTPRECSVCHLEHGREVEHVDA